MPPRRADLRRVGPRQIHDPLRRQPIELSEDEAHLFSALSSDQPTDAASLLHQLNDDLLAGFSADAMRRDG
ncbi:MAG: hypothetical protein AAFV53_04200 [Myxococcota bacterium]